METISYPYQKNDLGLIIGIVMLALILCPLSTLPRAFVLNPAGLVTLVGEVGLLTLMGGCGLTLLVVLMGIWAIYASQVQMEAILTPE
jgi:hypothetical protein